jgi:hypothetical protein
MAVASNAPTDRQKLLDYGRHGDLESLRSHIAELSEDQLWSIRDDNGATLLHYVCRYGQLEVLKYLMEARNVSFDALRAINGATCLHDAAVCDQTGILDHLLHLKGRNALKKHPSIIRDDQGNTILHLGKHEHSM